MSKVKVVESGTHYRVKLTEDEAILVAMLLGDLSDEDDVGTKLYRQLSDAVFEHTGVSVDDTPQLIFDLHGEDAMAGDIIAEARN